MEKHRVKLEDCPSCKTEKSIKIIFGKATEKGVEIRIEKCKNCDVFHSYNSKYELEKYEVVV